MALADTLRVSGRAHYLDQCTTATSLTLAVLDSAMDMAGSSDDCSNVGTETDYRPYSAGKKGQAGRLIELRQLLFLLHCNLLSVSNFEAM